MKRVAWAAVIAAVLAAGSIAAALVDGAEQLSLSLGSVAIVAAILSLREK